MKPKEFYDVTKALINEVYAFKEDKDKRHCEEYWKYARILKAEIDRVENILSKQNNNG